MQYMSPVAGAQVTTFGMGLVTLDVRQESTKHAQAIDAITTFLGLGSYLEWDEKKRQEFLVAELNSKRPLMPAGAAPAPPPPSLPDPRLPALSWSLRRTVPPLFPASLPTGCVLLGI